MSWNELQSIVQDLESPGCGSSPIHATINVSGGGDKTYEMAFTAASTVTVNHGLNKHPAVDVIDSAGDQVNGRVNHVSTSQCVVSFTAPFTGKITCN